jgi:hypothetical protein
VAQIVRKCAKELRKRLRTPKNGQNRKIFKKKFLKKKCVSQGYRPLYTLYIYIYTYLYNKKKDIYIIYIVEKKRGPPSVRDITTIQAEFLSFLSIRVLSSFFQTCVQATSFKFFIVIQMEKWKNKLFT